MLILNSIAVSGDVWVVMIFVNFVSGVSLLRFLRKILVYYSFKIEITVNLKKLQHGKTRKNNFYKYNCSSSLSTYNRVTVFKNKALTFTALYMLNAIQWVFHSLYYNHFMEIMVWKLQRYDKNMEITWTFKTTLKTNFATVFKITCLVQNFLIIQLQKSQLKLVDGLCSAITISKKIMYK